jgi:hypothetical protein
MMNESVVDDTCRSGDRLASLSLVSVCVHWLLREVLVDLHVVDRRLLSKALAATLLVRLDVLACMSGSYKSCTTLSCQVLHLYGL